MIYKEFFPGKKLSHIISTYWFFESLSSCTESNILPDCSMDIIFNFGNSFYSKDKINNNDIIITGMMTNFHRLFMEKNSRLFGIRFKPLGLNHFLNFGFGAIKNDIINLNSVIPDYYHNKFRNIFLLEKYNDIIDYFEMVFIDILNTVSYSIDFEVALALRNIYSSTIPTVGEIYKTINISQRYMEMKFKREIGINMKEFINIDRFLKAKKEIYQSDKNLTEIAVDNGYYDSSHMIKDFKKYTGSSPKKWK